MVKLVIPGVRLSFSSFREDDAARGERHKRGRRRRRVGAGASSSALASRIQAAGAIAQREAQREPCRSAEHGRVRPTCAQHQGMVERVDAVGGGRVAEHEDPVADFGRETAEPSRANEASVDGCRPLHNTLSMTAHKDGRGTACSPPARPTRASGASSLSSSARLVSDAASTARTTTTRYTATSS
jgi:hypothetical protein